jgi:hypothetical protein
LSFEEDEFTVEKENKDLGMTNSSLGRHVKENLLKLGYKQTLDGTKKLKPFTLEDSTQIVTVEEPIKAKPTPYTKRDSTSHNTETEEQSVEDVTPGKLKRAKNGAMDSKDQLEM